MRTKWPVVISLTFLLWAAIPLLAQSAPPAESAPAREARLRQQWMDACSAGSIAGRPLLQDRMPEIPPEKRTETQKKTAAAFGASRERDIYGPWVPLIRDPEMALLLRPFGDYLRHKTVLPAKLREFIIIITARQWTSQYEWHDHCPLAIEAGLNPEIAKALNEGRRPTGMSDDEAIVYDLCDELHRNQSVSDTTYAKALAKFGEAGIVDIVGVNAYYTLIAMESNVARTPLPNDGTKPALVVFPQ